MYGVYPRQNAHGLLCFVFLQLYHRFVWLHVIYLPISLRVTSLALGQSHDCPSANEVTLKYMGKVSRNLTTTKHNKTKDVCIILWMYCVCWCVYEYAHIIHPYIHPSILTSSLIIAIHTLREAVARLIKVVTTTRQRTLAVVQRAVTLGRLAEPVWNKIKGYFLQLISLKIG